MNTTIIINTCTLKKKLFKMIIKNYIDFQSLEESAFAPMFENIP